MLPPEWKWANAVTAFVGVLFASAGVWRIQVAYAQRGPSFTGQTAFAQSMVVDRFAIYFFYLFLGGTAIAILMSVRYLEIEHEHHGEFYALMLFSVVGMMCMAAGLDVVLIFIGLELMAISTYVLVGFLRTDRRSNEAALKYLLLGAFSSGIFAYGLSIFYGLSGSTNLHGISVYLRRQMAMTGGHADPIIVIALLTTATGLLFKIAAIPFHQLLPDAYEGAPTSITGFMSLGAFAVVTSLRQREVIGDEIDDIAGLFFRAPTEAILMLIFLLSLAGIPPLAGFYGKYFIFLSLIESGHYILASLAVLYAVFGLYYYMRIANAMLMRPAAEKEPLPVSLGMKVALGLTAFATVYIGIFPERFIGLVNWSLGLNPTSPVAMLMR